MNFPKEVQKLSELFGSLPNVGPKLSNRIALYLSINAKDLAKRMAESIDDMIANTMPCRLCGNISNTELCSICEDDLRDKSQIMVVEDPLDLINIEGSGEFKGIYHVLNGLISPINGIGPEEIRIPELIKRLKEENLKEIVIALNPTIEGEATGLYIKQEILKITPDIKVTRLAKGIPVGGDIEYVSGQTIVDSLRSRVEF